MRLKQYPKLRRFISIVIHFFWNLRYRFIYLLRGKIVGARALVFRENNGKEEVLLIKHTYTVGWFTIGGEVDKNESPLEAIKREIFEEAGVKATIDPIFFGVYHNTFKNRDDYVFFYIVKAFNIVECYCAEIEECKWFPIDELPSDISASTRRRIEEYYQIIPMTGKW